MTAPAAPEVIARRLGTRIRDRRQDPDLPGGPLTQEQLAEAVEVTQPSVSAWENGQAIPTVPVLIRLADVLDYTLDELLELERPVAA